MRLRNEITPIDRDTILETQDKRDGRTAIDRGEPGEQFFQSDGWLLIRADRENVDQEWIASDLTRTVVP